MPEISCFLGILILMHFREHNPPHFHVRYNDFEAAILIESLGCHGGQTAAGRIESGGGVGRAASGRVAGELEWIARNRPISPYRPTGLARRPTMLLKIEQADALSPFHILLRFNDGRTGEVDIRPLFEEGSAGVFNALRDAAVAADFRLEYGTLCWPGDLDVASSSSLLR